MAEAADAVVIGAGVIGLAVARRLAMRGREVLVLEAGRGIGEETSSRNSEVIHAGIYYPPGSLKAKLCVLGRRLLYDFCAETGVTAKRVGKLIVSVAPDELPAMAALMERGTRNGVDDLAWLDRDQALALEPELDCVAAILSPSSGIVDSHAMMLALQAQAEERGATVVYRARAVGGEAGERLLLRVASNGCDEMVLACNSVVNCAGHGAHELARAFRGLDRATIPPRYLAKGVYFSVSGPAPFHHLIYPMPVPGALGIHVTLDLGGQIRLGPDIEWVDHIDYAVYPDRTAEFRRAVCRYWPGVAERDLEPSYAGVRPKIGGPNAGPSDFEIQGPAAHGIPGLVNLYGIESPGLTSALAIAEVVADLLTRTEQAGRRQHFV